MEVQRNMYYSGEIDYIVRFEKLTHLLFADTSQKVHLAIRDLDFKITAREMLTRDQPISRSTYVCCNT